jgi:Protein of unknown function with HXXEE motif
VRWLVDEWEWPYAGTVVAVFLLALLPLWWDATDTALALVWVVLPLYMLHQLEEHAGDRFRLALNAQFAGGREALTRPAAFWINAGAVWTVDVIALWLAYHAELAIGLLPVYLMGVNALTHIAAAVRARAYNPGLWTAIFVFVPVSVWAAVEIGDAADAGLVWQLGGLAFGLAVHAGIVAYLRARVASLKAAERAV